MNNFPTNFPSFPNFDPGTGSVRPERNNTGGQFGSALRDAIDQVEQLHTGAEQQVTDLLKGNRSDVQNVVIAVEKADIAFQMMMQVRNKIVNAYQEISRMQF